MTATGGGFTASAPIIVAPGPLRVAGIRYGIGAGKTLLVTVSLVDVRGRPVANAYVSVLVRRRGYPFATGRGTTLPTAARRSASAASPAATGRPSCARTPTAIAGPAGDSPINRFCEWRPPLVDDRAAPVRMAAPLGVFPERPKGTGCKPIF